MPATLDTTTDHTPGREPENLEDQHDEENETEDEDEEAEANAEPADSTVEKVTLEVPRPVHLAGIFQGLAQMVARGKHVLVTVARPNDDGEILVSFVPPRDSNDKIATQFVQVTATPEEIDQKLLDALTHYVPAFALTTRTAAEIAATQTKAAETAKNTANAAAASKKTTTPTRASGRTKISYLTVITTPTDAKLVVKDSAGTEHTVKPGVKTQLPQGTYTATASKVDHADDTKTVTLGDAPQTLKLALTANQPSLL